jgi:tetratricopeptide (TPR) repeat protein
MVIFSYLNFHEAREERVKAGVALTTANDAATKASAAVMSADDAATRVSKAEASVNGTVARVRQIEQSSVDMNNKTKQIQMKTDSGLKVFESNLKDIKDDADTLAIYYNAKGGNRSAHNVLIRLSNQGESRKGMLVKSLLSDSNLYYHDYKYSLLTQQVINKNTKQHYRPSAEKMYDRIYNDSDVSMREAYINEIAQRDLKYFVHDLVKITREDPNLKVACRAEKAIESLTGKKFENYPPYNGVQLWWDQEGNKDNRYSNSIHRLSEMPANFGEKDFDRVLVLLKEIIESRQGMCQSHASIAEIYLVKGDKDKAKEHYKVAIDQCDDVYLAKIRYAALLYQEGKKMEAFEMLSKTKQYFDDVAAFERMCRSLLPDISKEDGFTKIFNDK